MPTPLSNKFWPVRLWASVDVEGGATCDLRLFRQQQTKGDLVLTNMRSPGRVETDMQVHSVEWEIFAPLPEGDLEELSEAYKEACDPLRRESAAIIAYSGVLFFEFLQTRVEIAPAAANLQTTPFGVQGHAIFYQPLTIPALSTFDVAFRAGRLPKSVKRCILRVSLVGVQRSQGEF